MLAHHTYIRQDYQDMIRLCSQIKALSFTTEGKTEYPHFYRIEMRVRSIVGVNTFGIPFYQKLFTLHIYLPDNYPLAPPVVEMYEETSALPFHPHFSIYSGLTPSDFVEDVLQSLSNLHSLVAIFNHAEEYLAGENLRAMWIDYRPYSAGEGLASLVVRILRSLQYEPSFMSTDYISIGNSEALNWYLHQKIANPHYFPTDTVLPKQFKIQKKFEVNKTDMPKKFSILPPNTNAEE